MKWEIILENPHKMIHDLHSCTCELHISPLRNTMKYLQSMLLCFVIKTVVSSVGITWLTKKSTITGAILVIEFKIFMWNMIKFKHSDVIDLMCVNISSQFSVQKVLWLLLSIKLTKMCLLLTFVQNSTLYNNLLVVCDQENIPRLM